MRTVGACAGTGGSVCCGGVASTSNAPSRTYMTRGMRRTHLRGHTNILKRLLIHTGGFNLGLVMRHLTGVGTPRGLQGRIAAVIAFGAIRRGTRPRVGDLGVGSGDHRSAPLARLADEPRYQLVSERDLHHGLLD
jgi:hypothetical protein